LACCTDNNYIEHLEGKSSRESTYVKLSCVVQYTSNEYKEKKSPFNSFNQLNKYKKLFGSLK